MGGAPCVVEAREKAEDSDPLAWPWRFGEQVEMVADASGEFTRALGEDMLRPKEDVFGGVQQRSRRYSAVVRDGRFTIINIEPAKGAVCSLSDVLLTQL